MRYRIGMIWTCLVVVGLAATPAGAEIKLLDKEEHKLSFYGFLKLDATYQDGTLNSETAPRFVRNEDGETTNFTAMHSRFGLRWKGKKLENGLQIGGLLEWDLFDSSPNQMDFRTRLAALTVSRGRSTWLFGQHWDVFSPLNVTTLMTNGNFWQTGNLGFRRSQIRYTYSGDGGEFAFSLNDPTTSALREEGSPLVEGRFGLKFAGRGRLGLSGAWGADERGGESVDVRGLSVDWVLPLGERWTFKGEAADGENLSVFLGRSSVSVAPGSGVPVAQEATAGWAELVYSGERAVFWLGGASEEIDSGLVAGADVRDTLALFLGLRGKIGGGFSLGGEVAAFETTYLSGAEAEGNQFIFSAIYNF